MELIRKAGNMGKFYPANPKEIEIMIDSWNKIIDKNIDDPKVLKIKPKSIIAPHAGYIYSGFTANFAHRLVPNAKPKRVIVIGPSHHVYLRGISAGYFDAYETPFGNLKGDPEYLKQLSEYFEFTFAEEAHYVEHSTETQFPFIKYYEPDVKVIELIYGITEYLEVADLIEYLLRDPENVVVISTDLSHYYNQKVANELDKNCVVGVAYKNLEIIQEKCEACGKIGLEAIIKVAKDLYLETKVLDYRTSADVTGDTSSVVGYMSAVVYQK